MAGREVVIDDYVVARREKLSYGVRPDISSAPGHQYLHLPISLSPITVRIVGLLSVKSSAKRSIHLCRCSLAAYHQNTLPRPQDPELKQL